MGRGSYLGGSTIIYIPAQNGPKASKRKVDGVKKGYLLNVVRADLGG